MKLRDLLAGASLACLAAPWGGSAFAQAANTQDVPEARVETVIVTGSSIRRRVTESAAPLQIFTAEEITREGIANPEQLVMFLTANGTGLDNLASNADVVAGQARGNNGASSANLRGQGSAGTLVLLNGRRVAAHGLNGGAVDINQIPLAAIERVDVLKDGASAIYGTDAIGGVINFITKRNVTGVTINASTDQTQDGGGAINRASIVAGFGDLDTQSFNIWAAVSFAQNEELRGDERDFVDTFQVNRGLSVDTRGTPFATIFPLNAGPLVSSVSLLGGTTTAAGLAPFLPGTTIRASGGVNVLDLPGGAGCDSVEGQESYDQVLWAIPGAAFACAWDTGRAAVLQQPLETTTYVVRGTYRLGEHQISAELTGSDADASKRFSNVQLSPNTTTQNFAYPLLTGPAATAENTATYNRIYNALVAVFPSISANYGRPIAYRWRCVECGRREIDTNTKTQRLFVGIDGPLFEGWTYRSGLSRATSESQSVLGSGYYFRGTTGTGALDGVPGLIPALNSGLINPFLLPGQTQSQAGLDLLRAASAEGVVLYGGEFTVTQFDVSASGTFMTLPGGPAYAAVGVDYRKEEYRFNGDQRSGAVPPFILAAPFDQSNILAPVEREVKAVFVEFALPLFKDFELTLAARRDEYDGFGATTNPKISFRYKPIPEIMFRGSYGTGFRVPSFNQIFNGLQTSPYSGSDLADPLTCPGGVPSSAPGCATVQPTLWARGKLDLGPEEAEQRSIGLVIQPASSLSITLDWWSIERSSTITFPSVRDLVNNYNLFQDRFIRDPATNALLVIDQQLLNAGGSITTGIDVGIRTNWEAWNARWTVTLDGTYLADRRDRVLDNSPYSSSRIGVFTYGGDLSLRWKHNLTLNWRMDDWSASLTQVFRMGYRNQVLPGVLNGSVSPPDLATRVDDYVVYNATAVYRGFENFTITAGIKNLFNTDPPFAITYDSVTGSGSSWEPRVADPRGRAFTLAVQYSF